MGGGSSRTSGSTIGSWCNRNSGASSKCFAWALSGEHKAECEHAQDGPWHSRTASSRSISTWKRPDHTTAKSSWVTRHRQQENV